MKTAFVYIILALSNSSFAEVDLDLMVAQGYLSKEEAIQYQLIQEMESKDTQEIKSSSNISRSIASELEVSHTDEN